MKAVLMSIQPKWCELIANGKKTIEVRKTQPRLNTPFKVYIYCTLQGSNEFFKELKDQYGEYEALSKWNRENWGIKKGKVIGEFVCDSVYQWNFSNIKTLFGSKGGYFVFCEDLKATCLEYEEFIKYGNSKTLYGWHISNLVIYDKPRELGEFYKPCIDEEMRYCPCCKYGYEMFSPDEVECSADVPGACYEQICLNRVKRPPQSWCYVESEVDTE